MLTLQNVAKVAQILKIQVYSHGVLLHASNTYFAKAKDGVLRLLQITKNCTMK